MRTVSVMLGCVSCSSPSVCTACDPTGFFTLLGTTCDCELGYFLGSTDCVSCPFGCATCTGATACPTCIANMVFDGSNCVCDVGLIWSGSSCKPCSSYIYGCVQCVSTTVCTLCDGTVPYLALSGEVCNCTSNYVCSATALTCEACASCCPYSLFMDSASSTCATCSTLFPNCQSCISATCTICVPGSYLSGSGCVTYSSAIAGRLSCDSSSVCTHCDSSLHFTLAMSSCNCIGYLFNSGVCELCGNLIPGRITCSKINICTICDTKSSFLLDTSTS